MTIGRWQSGGGKVAVGRSSMASSHFVRVPVEKSKRPFPRSLFRRTMVGIEEHVRCAPYRPCVGEQDLAGQNLYVSKIIKVSTCYRACQAPTKSDVEPQARHCMCLAGVPFTSYEVPVSIHKGGLFWSPCIELLYSVQIATSAKWPERARIF